MAYWCAARIEPGKDRLATHCLALRGYEVYQPKIRLRRLARGRMVPGVSPLFPSYLFIGISSAWWDARWCPGVSKIVLDGERPARVPDKIIAEIRARETGGLIELPPKFKRGDRVRVVDGALSGIEGIFHAANGHERVVILLGLLGTASVDVAAKDVEKVD